MRIRRVVRRRRRKTDAPENDTCLDRDISGENPTDSGATGDESQSDAPVSKAGPAVYVAVPGEGGRGPSVIKADGNRERRRAVLPIIKAPDVEASVGVIGRPVFRERMGVLLGLIPQVTVVFDSEGPVTHKLVSQMPETGVVLVDGESGQQMARRAPVLNRDDVLARIPVVLVADAAGFEPPNEVAVVIGNHWSVLLSTSAENPLRLSRAIQKAAAGNQTLDAGIDKKLIRIASELSVERTVAKR